MTLQRQPTTERDYTTHTPLDPHVLAAIAGAMQSEDWHEMTFETPTRTPTTQGDVIVPLLQAGISGIYIGMGAAITVGIIGVNRGWPWWAPPATGAAVWAISSGVVWSRLLIDSRRLLRKVERIVRKDLDGDGKIGEPATTRLEVKLDRDGGGTTWLFQDLPVNPETFDQWARGVIGGRSLAQSAWTGKAGAFSRSEYDAMLAFLERARCVRWINSQEHAQGRELTRMGKAALEAHVNRDNARAHAHASNPTPPTRETRGGVGDSLS